jgi:hypothetical protein
LSSKILTARTVQRGTVVEHQIVVPKIERSRPSGVALEYSSSVEVFLLPRGFDPGSSMKQA